MISTILLFWSVRLSVIMNAYMRTLPLPGAVRPVRERGASALDRVEPAWPAPDPMTRVLDPAAMRNGLSPWSAPDPVMRFDLPAPELGLATAPVDRRIPWTDLVEPRYVVPVPDLHSASLAAVAPPVETMTPQAWPAPTLADAEPVVAALPVHKSTPARWAVGVAAAAGALAVGAAALVALL